MLIDAAHKEELRVVVLNDEKIEDFEVETAGKEQIKGNIYVAEVTRVEPSLQAAFVNYGGNRNGFLAFSEIHPGYFDLPKEERQALLDELTDIANRRKGRDQEQEDRIEEEQSEKAASKNSKKSKKSDKEDEKTTKAEDKAEDSNKDKSVEKETPESLSGLTPEEMEEDAKALAIASTMVIDEDTPEVMKTEEKPKKRRGRPTVKPKRHSKKGEETESTEKPEDKKDDEKSKQASKQTNKEDETEEQERRQPIHRRYNIGDVVKEGQRILIQVNKEERGNKGAAVSTYISLPGRYSVLMPNTPYAGGISRKITDFSVRKEIKGIVNSLNVPDSMGVIIRTAGVGQEEGSIKKDVENLLSLWKKIETAFNGSKKPPFVTHEDGSLAVRAIRDMFNDEIDEVQVSNRKTYRMAKDYMKSLMPESAKKVKEYKLQTPIFTHYGVEEKLNRLHTTRVNLPSGGYLIINPTEALVSVDVNSGKATQEKNIEETALKTNLEAAEEVCRQLRLRDLAGLVVIDFIDMEENRNERAVEKMMRKCVRKDRARIQIAPISNFGLLEMSRQRLRPSLGESTMKPCLHCNGVGLVPSLASAALTLLRSVEDENIRSKAERVIITTSSDLAVYILNHKRDLLKDMEERYGFDIYIRGDDKYYAPDHKIEVVRTDNRGNEKRHSHEVILREPLEETDNKRGGRRRGRKGKKDDNKPSNKPSSNKHSKGANNKHKNDNGKDNNQDDKQNKKDPKESKENTQEDSNNDNDEKSADNKNNRRRGGGRVRHLRRGSRRKDNENGTDTEQKADAQTDNKDANEKSSKASHKEDTAEPKKVNRQDRPQAKKKATVSKHKTQNTKPAASKGIVVEHVSETGKSSVSESKSETVTDKFQRWWNKTTN